MISQMISEIVSKLGEIQSPMPRFPTAVTLACETLWVHNAVSVCVCMCVVA